MTSSDVNGVLRCTSKYRKLFGLPHDLPEPELPSSSALGDWYANTLNIRNYRFLHYTSELSRLAVIVPLSPRRTAESRFVGLLRDLLEHLGVPSTLADLECATLGARTYARATNRSVLGTMRDQAIMVRSDITHGFSDSAWDLAVRLAASPTGPLDYDSPQRVAPRLIKAAFQHPRRVG